MVLWWFLDWWLVVLGLMGEGISFKILRFLMVMNLFWGLRISLSFVVWFTVTFFKMLFKGVLVDILSRDISLYYDISWVGY